MPNGQMFWQMMAEARGLHTSDNYRIEDWQYSDILWFRPKESMRPGQPTAFLDAFMPSIHYTLICDRCQTEWLEEVTTENRPRCFCCGRFVRLTHNYKEARDNLARLETDA